MNFQKYYKGPKRYYPDEPFNYQFDHIEKVQDREYLLQKLEQKKQGIKKELDKLFRGKSYAISGTTRKYPCILEKSCTFLGSKLSRHCKSKLHDTTETQGRFIESFLNHSVQYITLIVKAGSRKPTLCEKCGMFYERISSHLQYQHKLKPGTPSFMSTLENNQTRTEEFIARLYEAYQDSDKRTDSSENEEPEPKRDRVQKDAKYGNTEESDGSDAEKQKKKKGQSENKKEKRDKERGKDKEKKDKESEEKQNKKDEKSVKKQDKKERKPERQNTPQSKSVDTLKLFKSTPCAEITLRGKFRKVTPSKHKKEKVFQKKLPVTKEFREEHQLGQYEYRYYYSSAEELMKDYEQFIQIYCNRTLKSAEQYVLDIRDIWQEIDSEMSLNPNQFRDEENLEARFYLPQKQLLLDNKDKDPKDQDPQIQAPTIRSKLISEPILKCIKTKG